MINLAQYLLESKLFLKIVERKTITFDKTSVSNYGLCVILAGGPGSGKGYVSSTRLNGNFKVYDVDLLKLMYLKLQKEGKIIDNETYDLSNEEDVSKLHFKVKDHGWKNKQRELFFKQRENVSKILPNVLFDMVSDDIDDINKVINYAKPMGYEITLVWVACNMDVARDGNRHRTRHVSDLVIVKGHKGAYKTINGLLTNEYPDTAFGLDNVWIALSCGYGRTYGSEFKNDAVIKVEKKDDTTFNYTQKSLVDKFLEAPQPKEKSSKEETEKDADKYDDVKESLNNINI